MGQTASLTIPSDKHIVIVGAGYGGVGLALELLKDDNSNFTIINPKEYLHLIVASVRTIVEPDHAKKIFIPLAPTFGHHFKQDSVVAIRSSDQKVLLQSGEEVSYDVLVIATGCRGSFPNKVEKTTREAAIEDYTHYQQKVAKSHRIVVIGGGPTGTEIAAEVATDYPDSEVTLLHSGQQLVTKATSAGYHKKLHGILSRMKIKVIFGERVSNLDECLSSTEGPVTVHTDKGSQIEADLVIPAIGLKVNSSAYQDGLDGSMDEAGRLKVNQYLQVEGHKDIYAIGDCCNTQEPKWAYMAGEHATLLAANLRHSFNDKQLQPYKPDNAPFVSMIALGRHSGIGQMKSGWMMGEWFVNKLKSGHMFVPKKWKSMNQPLPA